MPLYFATSNMAKFSSVQSLYARDGYSITQLNTDCIEPCMDTLEEIAQYKAKEAYEICKAPVLVDDSGFFFDAYQNFPGVRSAWVYKAVGYEGLSAILKGKIRTAKAKTVVCFTLDGKTFKTFSGEFPGKIIEDFDGSLIPRDERMPYKEIFIPDGYTCTLLDFDTDKLNAIGHRGQAFGKALQYLLTEVPSLSFVE